MSSQQVSENVEVIKGDVEYDGRVILYVIKGGFSQ
jgi:hypothetical protein